VASIADGSIETAIVVGMTTAEDDESIMLDWDSNGVVIAVSEDMALGDNTVVSVGRLTTGSTEDSMAVEVGMALPTSLARLENISVAVGS